MAVWSYENTIWSKMTKRDWKWFAALVVAAVVTFFLTAIDADRRYTNKVDNLTDKYVSAISEKGVVFTSSIDDLNFVFTDVTYSCPMGNVFYTYRNAEPGHRITGCWDYQPGLNGIEFTFRLNNGLWYTKQASLSQLHIVSDNKQAVTQIRARH